METLISLTDDTTCLVIVQYPDFFGRVYDYITDKCPQLAPKTTHIIHEWIAQGYDPEKDIIPAVDAATKHGALRIHSFSYFSGYIRSQNERRSKAKPPERTQEEKDAIRAKNIRWHRDKGLTTTRVGLQDFDWLDEYDRRKEDERAGGRTDINSGVHQ